MKYIKILVVGALVFQMSACDSFLDINTDPNAAVDVPGALLFPTMLAAWGSNRAMEGGQYTNYFSQTFSSNSVLLNWWQAENYQISATAVNNHWLAYYGTIQRNASLGIAAAMDSQPQRLNEAAQFKLLSAFNYYEATLLWEDTPFTQANQPVEFPEPVFDSQQTVLNGVIGQINDAMGLIDPATPGSAVGAGDVIYSNNMQNWIRLANSMKLHVYMTLRGGGQNVDTEIQALINNPNLIRLAEHNAYIPFSTSSQNPLGRMIDVYAPGSANWFWSGAPVTAIMNEWEDPRRPVYMQPNNAGEFDNAPAGTGIGQANASRTRVDTYLAHSMPVPLMYAHEVLFLEAEWLAANGQLGPADAKFREGIVQAFRALNTTPEGNTGGAGRAPGMASGEITPAQRQAFIDQFPSLTTLSVAEALELIWHQHYVGLHGDGIQSWTLVRRVGEPIFGMSLSPSTVLTSWVSRWPYQINEVAANPNAPQENPPLEQNMWFQNNAQQ